MMEGEREGGRGRGAEGETERGKWREGEKETGAMGEGAGKAEGLPGNGKAL